MAEVRVVFSGDAAGAVAASEATSRAIVRVVEQADRTGGALARVGQGISSLGATLTRTLTPVAAAIGAAGAAAFRDWDAGIDTVRVRTGATGRELEALEDVVESVGARSTQSIGRVGEVVADLNSRLGLTGRPLETIAKRFLELERIGMGASVEQVSRAFGDWSVKTERQEAVLDQFFRAAQASGVKIDSLASSVVRFGAPLRQMGFGLEEAIAIVSKFEREGVNTELVLGSMRIALGKLAKEGKEPVAAFRDIVRQIERTGSTATANRLSIELFGARAGPDMAAAIREGRFEIESYIKQIAAGKDTVAAAASDTVDWSDKLSMWRNQVVAAVGPYGELVAAVGAGLAAIGPTLFAVGQMLPLLTSLAGFLRVAAAAQWLLNAALTANPIGVMVVALAALVAGIVLAWQHSETFRRIVTAAFDTVRAAAEAVLGFFRGAWSAVGGLVSAPFLAIVEAARGAFGLRDAIVGAFRSVADFMRNNWPEIATLVSGPFALIVAPATNAFGVRTALVNAFNAIATVIDETLDRIVGWFGALPDRLAAFVGPLANRVTDPIRRLFGQVDAVLEAIIASVTWMRENFVKILSAVSDGLVGPLRVLQAALEPVERVLGQILAFLEGIRDKAGDVIDAIERIGGAAGKIGGFIPGLQHGGPARAGQPYLVGERGPEIFVPRTNGMFLPNSALRSASGGAALGAGSVTYVVNAHVHTDGVFMGSEVELSERLARLVKPELGRVAMYESRV